MTVRGDRNRLRSGKIADQLARQLQRGKRITNYTKHHKGMAAWKAMLGDPRPDGMTLSLIVFEGPDVYEAQTKGGNSVLVSMNPAHYCWESLADNNARDAARRAEAVTA